MCITKLNLQQTQLSSNSPNRSYDPRKKNLQSLVHKLCILEITIKSVNTTLNHKTGEIFYLEALFKSSEDNQLLDSIFTFKATSDLDTMYYH